MSACPICATPAARRITATPYHECPACLCWFQSPFPPKTYHGPEEPPITDVDRAVNADLARWLLANPMRGKPGRTLDIGCKEPVLAAALAALGCDAVAIDGVMPLSAPGVHCMRLDFESDEYSGEVTRPYALITMVHVFEHMGNPLRTLRRLRRLVSEDGRVFLRLPDHHVSGFERDLTPHHFSIHPMFHCLTSILEALRQTETFVIESATAMPGFGQRDITLSPL